MHASGRLQYNQCYANIKATTLTAFRGSTMVLRSRELIMILLIGALFAAEVSTLAPPATPPPQTVVVTGHPNHHLDPLKEDSALEHGNVAASAQMSSSASDKQLSRPLFEFEPGLWQQNAVVDGKPASISIEMCLDAAVAPNASIIVSRFAAPGYPGCQIEQVKRTDTIDFSVNCSAPGRGTSHTVSTLSKAPDGDYFLAVTVSVSSDAQRTEVHQLNNRFHRVGVCPAGQRAGDVTAIISGKRQKLPSLQALDQTSGK